MTDYAFLLDLGRCIGCEACVAACKTGNELPTELQFIQISEKSTGTSPDVTSRVLTIAASTAPMRPVWRSVLRALFTKKMA